MNNINKEFILNEVIPKVKESGREIDYYTLLHILGEDYSNEIIKKLMNYKNDDGGFGHALEPDFRMPNSSSIATLEAVHYLNEISTEKKEDIIKGVVRYFENTYNEERKGWYSVTKEVNDYPHAIWWSYDTNKSGSSIDDSWGNPSLEIVGFLYKYKDYLTSLNIDELLNNAKDYIRNSFPTKSEHELYCAIRFYDYTKSIIEDDILEMIVDNSISIVNTNIQEWDKYVPKPLDFITEKNLEILKLMKEKMPEISDLIELELSYKINNLKVDKIMMPNWEWYQYDDVWNEVKYDWCGKITYKAIKNLCIFNKIQK